MCQTSQYTLCFNLLNLFNNSIKWRKGDPNKTWDLLSVVEIVKWIDQIQNHKIPRLCPNSPSKYQYTYSVPSFIDRHKGAL